MQKAILCVLILIAVILAPWLLVPMIALVVAYGAWLAVAAIVLVLFLLALTLKDKLFAANHKSIDRVARESNERYREKVAAAERLKAAERTFAAEPSKPERKPRTKVNCSQCQSEIDRHSMYCPACGKDPRQAPK